MLAKSEVGHCKQRITPKGEGLINKCLRTSNLILVHPKYVIIYELIGLIEYLNSKINRGVGKENHLTYLQLLKIFITFFMMEKHGQWSTLYNIFISAQILNFRSIEKYFFLKT